MLSLETEVPPAPSAAQPSPAIVFETLNRYQHTMALKGAIDLDLFTHIAAGASTSDAIAARCQAPRRSVRILCDFLTIIGFLRKSGDRYDLTPESALFLNRRSPAYIGTIAGFLAGPDALDSFCDVAALVRQGEPFRDLTVAEPENGRWPQFARAMRPVVAMTAQIVAPLLSKVGTAQKVLDVAAGSGLFGISVAQLNPRAEIFALDSRSVLEVATENAAKAGVADRYRTIAGDAFQVGLGDGYDLVLIGNFLHHFDSAANIEFLRKVRAALKPGGCVAIIEFVPNEDRVSPPIPASFSLQMLASTRAGDVYTITELEEMLQQAGFTGSRNRLLPPTPLTLILSEA